ncbi:MAG: glucose-1-phosphate adenylyltransferase [Candidatus Hydrogenedentes bacterium]|nr:glucose-1-phosphate adenylyltransferase [Candidatus Hydrogenedentota bacterium]
MADLYDMREVIAVVLAGGQGERLHPLTQERAKPAVQFGGHYRLIDFTLSNCLNSQCRRVLVLVQYKSQSLVRHIRDGWGMLSGDLNEYIEAVPAQKRVGEDWYLGTADAIYQNLYSIEPSEPKEVLILSGDHIYKMDYGEMIAFHRRNGADLTIAAIEMPIEQANRFGVLEVDYTARVSGFQEKPSNPASLPDQANTALASMGVYVFNTAILRDAVTKDAKSRKSSHDFGKDILPELIGSHSVYAYMFRDENKKSIPYWRDVGTLDSYWEANMDLVDIEPFFNLYDKDWPIRTRLRNLPPAKFVFGAEGVRFGAAVDSIVSLGCIVSGGLVKRSVLSPNVRVNSYSHVEESILLPGCNIGRNCRIRRAIVERDVAVPENTIIGYDAREDAKRFHVSPGGVVVVTDTKLTPRVPNSDRMPYRAG